jgi:hypothetical protein
MTKSGQELIPIEIIEGRIFNLRGCRVMLDRDLAELYGVPVKRLNEQVKRNSDRFPDDFMFQLTLEEGEPGQNIKYRPHAFSEHGAVMLANVLRSPVAVRASISGRPRLRPFAPNARDQPGTGREDRSAGAQSREARRRTPSYSERAAKASRTAGGRGETSHRVRSGGKGEEKRAWIRGLRPHPGAGSATMV